jgi:hypothetical protein
MRARRIQVRLAVTPLHARHPRAPSPRTSHHQYRHPRTTPSCRRLPIPHRQFPRRHRRRASRRRQRQQVLQRLHRSRSRIERPTSRSTPPACNALATGIYRIPWPSSKTDAPSARGLALSRARREVSRTEVDLQILFIEMTTSRPLSAYASAEVGLRFAPVVGRCVLGFSGRSGPQRRRCTARLAVIPSTAFPNSVRWAYAPGSSPSTSPTSPTPSASGRQRRGCR